MVYRCYHRYNHYQVDIHTEDYRMERSKPQPWTKRIRLTEMSHQSINLPSLRDGNKKRRQNLRDNSMVLSVLFPEHSSIHPRLGFFFGFCFLQHKHLIKICSIASSGRGRVNSLSIAQHDFALFKWFSSLINGNSDVVTRLVSIFSRFPLFHFFELYFRLFLGRRQINTVDFLMCRRSSINIMSTNLSRECSR